jgi:putative flippase GtrA
MDSKKDRSGRRRLLKFATIGGVATLALPDKWVAPIVKSVVVPAHAAASPSITTSTTTTTTTSTTTYD